jgi:uncharacterized membrane protein YhhN
MKPKQLTIFIAAALFSLIDIALTAFDKQDLRLFTKPLIIPLMIWVYILSIDQTRSWWRDAIVLGLVCSWVGDILLQVDGMFIPGLCSFLFAHIFYITFFVSTKSDTKSFFKLRPVMLIAVLAYLIELMHMLWPTLGPLKIPVLAYGITISIMLSAALWQYQKLEDRTAILFIIGAFFFTLSDSILAINKFRSPFEQAGVYTMTTYIIAQLLIVVGAIRYRNTPK